MNYVRTFGPAVDPITQLGWALATVSILVILIIGSLLVAGIYRKRPLPSDPATLTVHSDTGGMSWIYIGVGVSSFVLAVCMVLTFITINAVARPPAARELTLQVTASQWWWSVEYQNADAERVFTTANEIHIPVGLPVRFELISSDVIHSFWIPQLAGKMDVIPGQVNVTWLQANHAGTYRGQCAAFCGAQHAHMALFIVAEAPAEFAAWESNQLSEKPPASTGEAARGQQVFETHCAVCHTIRGVAPAGIRGPDLTHLMTRSTIAAGLLPNTPGNLAGWIANSQSLKPGARMP
ncbi:MAG: cytochrome c oxidase subunit II, partial [Terriglobia bacterium]